MGSCTLYDLDGEVVSAGLQAVGACDQAHRSAQQQAFARTDYLVLETEHGDLRIYAPRGAWIPAPDGYAFDLTTEQVADLFSEE